MLLCEDLTGVRSDRGNGGYTRVKKGEARGSVRGMDAGANADAIGGRNGAEHSGVARQRGTIETR